MSRAPHQRSYAAAARPDRLRFAIVAGLALLVACGGDDDGPAPGADGGGTCTDDASCDDGMFCNGPEVCESLGCASGDPPCGAGEVCDEGADACMACEVEADADGDGRMAMACGGDDCDDADPNRFPGNPEVCDTEGHDEDCDPTTFGFRDGDMDGVADAACCNDDGAGGSNCGTDCDDAAPGVNPMNPEVCNGEDVDCDGTVDEGVVLSCYNDDDGDDYAPDATVLMMGCTCPPGTTMREPVDASSTDCDDSAMDTFPGARERCDRRDNDCSSGGGGDVSEDMDDDGFAPPGAACNDGFPRSDCNDDDARVNPGITTAGQGICPAGYRFCRDCGLGTASCYRGITATCGFLTCGPDQSAPFYDYDCNGVDTPIRPASGSCTAMFGCVGCGPDGYRYTSSDSCGDLVTYQNCGCAAGMTCRASNSMRNLPCL